MEITDAIQTALARIVGDLGDGVELEEDLRGEPLVVADRASAHELIRRLRDDEALRCDCLIFITAQDNYLDEPRFDVIYCLRSMSGNFDVRVKVPVGGDEPALDTITDLYPTANWHEREVWDMFGVRFPGHPDLERILMGEGFEAHPLRKDFPLLGNTPGTPGYRGKGGKR